MGPVPRPEETLVCKPPPLRCVAFGGESYAVWRGRGRWWGIVGRFRVGDDRSNIIDSRDLEWWWWFRGVADEGENNINHKSRRHGIYEVTHGIRGVKDHEEGRGWREEGDQAASTVRVCVRLTAGKRIPSPPHTPDNRSTTRFRFSHKMVSVPSRLLPLGSILLVHFQKGRRFTLAISSSWTYLLPAAEVRCAARGCGGDAYPWNSAGDCLSQQKRETEVCSSTSYFMACNQWSRDSNYMLHIPCFAVAGWLPTHSYISSRSASLVNVGSHLDGSLLRRGTSPSEPATVSS